MTGAETIDQKLARLQPMFFDPNVDPIVTNKTPGAGKDILQASANNLYSGVSLADLKGFTEKYGLNSRLVKQNGKLVEEVYRDRRQVRHLHHRDRQAPRSREAVRRTADGQGARRADQVLSHRRGRRSQGLRHRVGPGQGLAGRHHQRLHRGLPRSARHQGQLGRRWSSTSTRRRRSASRPSPPTRSGSRITCRGTPKYRKPSVQGIVANAIDVVVETGDSGPVTPIGINLPNDQAIREKYGSKSVALLERQRGLRQVGAGHRCAASSRGTPDEAQRVAEVRDLRRRADHRHARSDRPRVGPAGRGQGQSAGADQGALLRARRRAAPISSACTSSPIRSWSSSASSPPPITTTSCAPNTRPTRATRWCSCAASAKARRSKKTTCATAR